MILLKLSAIQGIINTVSEFCKDNNHCLTMNEINHIENEAIQMIKKICEVKK